MIRYTAAIGLVFALGFGPLHAQGPHDAIKVHGQWVVDVRQPDGTLVEHRDFHNDVIDAPKALSGLLGGTYGRLDHLRIELNSDRPLGSFCQDPADGVGLNGPCLIVPPGAFASDEKCPPAHDFCLHTMTIDPPGNAVTLHGTVVVDRSVSQHSWVTTVRLVAILERPDHVTREVALTGITVDPIQVVGGQTIQVSVTISFT